MQPLDSYSVGIHMKKSAGGFVRNPAWLIAIIVVVVLIAAAAWFLFAGGAPVSQLSSPLNLVLQQNQSAYFRVGNSTAISVVSLRSPGNSSAVFYISDLPILNGPMSVVTILSGGGVNLSTSGSSYANINIALLSSNSTGARIKLTPLASSLSIRTSRGVSLVQPPSFFSQGPGVVVNVTITTTAATSSTTVGSTSTILNTTSGRIAAAYSIANASAPGALMLKLKALYEADVHCNASTYNTTYLAQKSRLPTGPFTFVNVTPFVPTDITASAVQAVANNYLVTYSTVAPSSLSSGPALLIGVNISSATSSHILNVTFRGIFQGDNYTMVNSAYAVQSRIGNACAAYIT